MLSVDSQVKEMLTLAEREGLDVAEIRHEAHSTKDTGQRKVFNELIRIFAAVGSTPFSHGHQTDFHGIQASVLQEAPASRQVTVYDGLPRERQRVARDRAA